MIETARIRREKASSPPAVARDYRKELWIAVCSSITTAENCRSPNVGPTWADHALARFDATFPEGAP